MIFFLLVSAWFTAGFGATAYCCYASDRGNAICYVIGPILAPLTICYALRWLLFRWVSKDLGGHF